MQMNFPGNDWKNSPLLEVLVLTDSQKLMCLAEKLLALSRPGKSAEKSVQQYQQKGISLVFQMLAALGTWDTQLFLRRL